MVERLHLDEARRALAVVGERVTLPRPKVSPDGGVDYKSAGEELSMAENNAEAPPPAPHEE